MNIRQLALQTIANIRNKQHWYTASSRKKALAEFENLLNKSPRASDEEIVLEAKKQIFTVNMFGWFGVNGRQGSSFLAEMHRFTQQADPILAESRKKTKKELLHHVRSDFATSMSKIRNTISLFTNVEIPKNIFDNKRVRQRKLEYKIDELYRQHHYNTHAQQTWLRYIKPVWNEEDMPKVFFNNEEIKQLHPDLEKPLKSYKKLLDKPYLDALAAQRRADLLADAEVKSKAPDYESKFASRFG